MPHAQSDGAKLYYEETGTGHPILFVHEFGGDHRSWEQQIRFFSRQYRCIAFNARGYPPSDVPPADSYGLEQAVGDIAAVLFHLGIERAHLVGLSMGAYAAMHFTLRHPQKVSAMVLAGCGSGSAPEDAARFRQDALSRAERFERDGLQKLAEDFASAPTRIKFRDKDPRGWQEAVRNFSEHSAEGSARTLRNYQASRPSIYENEAELARLAMPVLVAVGDDDRPCIAPSLFLKRTIPHAGMWMAPRTGHCVNIEEPAGFNAALLDFFGMAERGRWV